ncbi:MAG TPA: hypothetical protein DDX39_08390 [Bacteroidales bacterium]|nr:MAG: hypothetical protein A2W98_09825 [Bacteroidetes bacterium GWF2_33_38]OFY72321.1 MAG: hypothetical protein A2265_00565 [Bacteroidetes bacterium RIFOXYA12_FULL_33_9]OFY90364.1 MAG: hypothetical protein A2236_06605 [Bacteroidetes bacterium RIFOXYA2_FULL_33_7]HBF88645.1 hypothetical protein [Bacteroidales bacterium]
MKNLSVISIIVVIAFITSGCSGLKKMVKNAGTIQYSVTPEILQMHADSVAIGISGKFPEKFFNKKATVVITPVIKWEGGEKALKEVKLQGEKVEDNNTVIKVAGGNFSYNDKIPYVDDMKISTLEVKATAAIKKKTAEFEPKKIGNGVIATPRLLLTDARAIIAKDNFQRITPEIKEADIHFAVQQANIRPGEMSQEDIKGLKNYLVEVLKAENKELKGVSVSAYASPDGAEDLNAKLSENRGVIAEKFVGTEFKNVKTPKFTDADKAIVKEKEAKFKEKAAKAQDKSVYSTKSTAEDWDGFQKLMKSSDLQDKDLIVRVLEMYSDPVRRETEIKNIASVYPKVADKILPQLRRSMLKINVDVVGLSDEEIITLAKATPDSLTVEELLYAATLTNDNNVKLDVYKACETVYPQEWRGFNNAGCQLVKLNKIPEAKEAFAKAKELKDGEPIVMNNFGVVAFYENDYVKSEEYLNSAAGAGAEVNYNLGLLSVKKADYEGAVKYFGSDCSFNAALAILLNGDAEGASKRIDCIEDKEVAMNYYLKAVAGARTANTDLMFNNLRAAIGKSASLAGKAKTDMEFFKYFEDETFKSIVR